MTLRKRLLTLLISIMFVSLSAMGFLYLRFLETSLRRSVSSSLETIAESNTDLIARFVDHCLAAVASMAKRLPVDEVERRNIPLIEERLKEFMESNLQFANGLFLLDPHGVLWADYPPHPGIRGNSVSYTHLTLPTIYSV